MTLARGHCSPTVSGGRDRGALRTDDTHGLSLANSRPGSAAAIDLLHEMPGEAVWALGRSGSGLRHDERAGHRGRVEVAMIEVLARLEGLHGVGLRLSAGDWLADGPAPQLVGHGRIGEQRPVVDVWRVVVREVDREGLPR